MLFAEVPFLDRFAKARAAGFEAVEFQFPYEFSASDIQLRLNDAGLGLELFNFPAGNFAAGDRGMASDPQRTNDFRESIQLGLEYAAILKPAKMNCLAGKHLPHAELAQQFEALHENLTWAANKTQAAGIKLVAEPLNPFDAPNFILPTPTSGFTLVRDIGHPNLKVEYDIYHAQRTEGNIIWTLENHLDQIGHIQVADSPGRNEPGTGELNFPVIFAAIDRLGYADRIGLEYKPSTPDTLDSLTWMKEIFA
jgi:hydroxypyruvate isomerase